MEIAMKYAEKIPKGLTCPKGAPSALRWLKRMVRRARRRAEQRDPENVPGKFTKGWYW